MPSPARFLVNMLGVWLFGFSEFGPKLMQTILQAVGSYINVLYHAPTLRHARRRRRRNHRFGLSFCAADRQIRQCQRAAHDRLYGHRCMLLYACGSSAANGGWRVLSGAALSWAPLFKPTGVSAIAAVALFVIAQPFLKHRTFKQTVTDIVLLLAGFIAAVAPIWVWLLAKHEANDYLPYMFVIKAVHRPQAGRRGTNLLCQRRTRYFRLRQTMADGNTLLCHIDSADCACLYVHFLARLVRSNCKSSRHNTG